MRIIAGKYKGRRIKTLKGFQIRPTSDRVREALYNILGDMVQGSLVLDLFAGSGSLGLEALSRGAKKVFFGENNHAAWKIINANVAGLRLGGECEVIYGDYRKVLNILLNRHISFNLILLDPPYQVTEKGETENVLSLIKEFGTLRKNGLVVIEHSRRTEINTPESSWGLIQKKNYGGSSLSILEKVRNENN